MTLSTFNTPFTESRLGILQAMNVDGIGFTFSEPGTYSLSCNVPWAYDAADSIAFASMSNQVDAGHDEEIVVTTVSVTKYVKTASNSMDQIRIEYDVPNPGDVGDSLTESDVQTISRTKLVVALTDAATVTPNANTTDVGKLASVSQTTTFANPTGTPVDAQSLELRVKSASIQSVSFGNAYRASTDIALPTATRGSALTERWLFEWNAAASKWDILANTGGH